MYRSYSISTDNMKLQLIMQFVMCIWTGIIIARYLTHADYTHQ